MKDYTVTAYTEGPDTEHHTLSSHTVPAADAHAALLAVFPQAAPAYDAQNDMADWQGPRFMVAAEPAEPQPIAQSPQFGALRETIARALVAETLAEAAVAELARVAELPVVTAHTCLLSMLEWIPGDPITDEQCKVFIEHVENTEDFAQ